MAPLGGLRNRHAELQGLLHECLLADGETLVAAEREPRCPACSPRSEWLPHRAGSLRASPLAFSECRASLALSPPPPRQRHAVGAGPGKVAAAAGLAHSLLGAPAGRPREALSGLGPCVACAHSGANAVAKASARITTSLRVLASSAPRRRISQCITAAVAIAALLHRGRRSPAVLRAARPAATAPRRGTAAVATPPRRAVCVASRHARDPGCRERGQSFARSNRGGVEEARL